MSAIPSPRLPAGGGDLLASLGVSRTEAAGLVRTAAPVAALALVNMAMSVTDTLMAAALGADALAAAAVGSDFYSIVFYLAIGVLGGLAPLYATAHKAGNEDPLCRLRLSGWVIAAVVCVPSVAAVWLAPGLLIRIGIDPLLLERGAGYTHAMALTIVPMVAVTVLRTRLIAIERAGALFRVTVAAVPLNAGLNLVLMHGIGEWEGLDLTGAGVSSLLVACFMFAVFARLSARCNDRGLAGPIDWTQVGEIVRLGVPIGIATLSEVGIYLGATLYVATLSVADAAAHAVAIRTAGVTYAASIGLLQAATVRFARAESEVHRHRQIVATALAVSLVTGLAIAAALAVAGGPLASVLDSGDAAGAALIAVQLLLLLAVAEAFAVPGATAAGLLRGMRVTRPTMVFSLVGNWLVAAPVAFLLSSQGGLGAVGVWIGLAAGSVIAAVLTADGLRRWSSLPHAPRVRTAA